MEGSPWTLQGVARFGRQCLQLSRHSSVIQLLLSSANMRGQMRTFLLLCSVLLVSSRAVASKDVSKLQIGVKVNLR